MDRLPPTRDALNLLNKRAYLQTQIWASSLLKKINFKNQMISDGEKTKKNYGFRIGAIHQKLEYLVVNL